MKIGKIGLVANVMKPDIRDILAAVLGGVPRGVAAVALEDTARIAAGRIEVVSSLAGCDAVVALGGDGTLLMAARMVAEDEIPLLGIKVRSLGFLTEDDPGRAIGDLFGNRFLVQERMRLDVTMEGAGQSSSTWSALNDAVIHGVGVSRVIHLRMMLDGESLGEYLADGVIVSTPTGSTAYSLAAGGPIVNPTTVEAFIITPLCPHSLSVRPLVVSSRETFAAELVEDVHDTLLTIDGQETSAIGEGQRVVFRRSSKVTKLIVTEGYNFYDVVRRKLRWGGVLRQH